MTIMTGFFETPQGKADTVITGIYKDNVLSTAAERFNSDLGGLLIHHLDNQSIFNGKPGQTLTISAPRDSQYSRIILLGLGDVGKNDLEEAETIGGKLFMALKGAGTKQAALYLESPAKKHDQGTAVFAAHIAAGVKLRGYEFKKYKTREKDEDKAPSLEWFHFISPLATQAKAVFEPLSAALEGVYLARDLVNEPANHLYPDSFAQHIKDELKPLGVEVEIFDEKKMEKLGFHAHLAVGMGSSRPPRVVIMRWKGGDKQTGKDKGPLAFVGKGVTFDTGGINLKPGQSMTDMKLDMGGAAAVVGAMKALALRKAKVDVVGVAGLAENMPSHLAYRPGDVIKSHSGQTIEVLNTDAEGRLVLADALSYIQKTDKPRLIVDLATLTGAMMVALGYEYCGVFANQDDLWDKLDQSAKAGNEKLWRMPLDEAYRKAMDSDIADIQNLGSIGRYAGACTAAAFLERFIEGDTAWAHMDIAGVAWIKSDTPTCPKPVTGFGVRTLERLAAIFE